MLGAMLTLMGLFPGFTGLDPTVGIGIVQIFAMLIGFSLLILGALIYVKFTFYSTSRSNLMQQIGTRLAMTGLVLASMAALADVLGFGSHGVVTNLDGATGNTDIFLGRAQAIGILVNFLIASLGVLIYAISGDPDHDNGE
jgi:hypothetical protein